VWGWVGSDRGTALCWVFDGDVDGIDRTSLSSDSASRRRTLLGAP